MRNSKNDLVKYRLARAHETFEDAVILAENNKWNSAINRLYYAAFYAVSALIIIKNQDSHTHNGVKSKFSVLFIKTGIIDKEF
ncbi:HEPN domain-containing protein [Algoriphagus sp. C2-6-M1]|uniref:HEPN domain-containing protein n=1 Tax=Algoriphagus persicinus TaxID=3108754 RepID=UPI002B3F0C79|nr:HEPN domain-containing protein [Algoriphagus sp. C2-6-M1]MEB2778907.1 HEPN domain-containing protein [Algoriphagus sp. C2-6-M1]